MNKFTAAFDARIAIAIAKKSTASNIQALQDMRAACTSAQLVALFETSSIDAERFTRAIYASKKTMRFAQIATDTLASKYDANTYCVFRTAINCAKHNVLMTRNDAMCSISRDQKVSDDKSAIVYQRNTILDAKTIAAQHQTSLDALITLNILKQSASDKNSYEVVLNDLAIAICEKLDIDYKLDDAE